jgi:hypothetical protein
VHLPSYIIASAGLTKNHAAVISLESGSRVGIREFGTNVVQIEFAPLDSGNKGDLMLESNAHSYTDNELRQANLLIGDPLGQEGLVEALADGVRLSRLENLYAMSHDIPKIRCGACGRRLHRHGFTAILSTGDRLLLGSSCGGSKFGSWEAAKRELKQLRDRKYYLERADTLSASLPQISSEIANWESVATIASSVVAELKENLPDLYSTLKNASERDGRLTITRRVHMRDLRRDGTVKITFRYEHVDLGPIPGRALFLLEDTRKMVTSARNAFHDFVYSWGDGEGISTVLDLQRSHKEAVDAAESLNRVLASLVGLADFFAPAGLDAVVDWTKSGGLAGSYQASSRSLSQNGGEIVVSLPARYAPPTSLLLELVGVLLQRRDRERRAA